mmetsp:Transcript_28709/g.76601  ORF Transcript_28709/g.76601 Transcript_28709/m.76601 type:complete len:455 (+) Transcript_28709:280-1644(+)
MIWGSSREKARGKRLPEGRGGRRGKGKEDDNHADSQNGLPRLRSKSAAQARSCNVLALQDFKRLLEALNFLFARFHTLLVAEPCVEAVSLQLVVVIQNLVQLLLRQRELLLGGAQVALGVCFVTLLVLLLDRLHILRLRGLGHVLLVRGLGLLLSQRGLGLQAGEVGQADLQHADHATLHVLHALVRLLQKRGVRLGVELAEHLNGTLHGALSVLGVGHRLGVDRLLLAAELGRLLLLGQDLGDVVPELGDFLCEELDVGGKLVCCCIQRLDLGGFVFARLLVRCQLGAAERIVVCLCVSLLHQLDDEILDHLLDLAERILRHAGGHQGEVLAAQLLGLRLQVRGGLPAALLAPTFAAQLRQGRRLLDQLRQVLLGVPADLVAGQDLVGLGDGNQLLLPQHLVLLVLLRLCVALGVRVGQDLLVVGLRLLGYHKIPLGIGGGLQPSGLFCSLLL